MTNCDKTDIEAEGKNMKEFEEMCAAGKPFHTKVLNSMEGH